MKYAPVGYPLASVNILLLELPPLRYRSPFEEPNVKFCKPAKFGTVVNLPMMLSTFKICFKLHKTVILLAMLPVVVLLGSLLFNTTIFMSSSSFNNAKCQYLLPIFLSMKEYFGSDPPISTFVRFFLKCTGICHHVPYQVDLSVRLKYLPLTIKSVPVLGSFGKHSNINPASSSDCLFEHQKILEFKTSV